MPLNTASQNPNTFDVIPSRADYGTARGSCSLFELPTAGNTFGDTIQVVDVGMRVYTWDGSAWIDPVGAGGGGASAFADLTDKTSADLPAINTPLSAALATKASALAPVSLSANTTLTRAAHYNRLIVVDVTAGNVTLTATGTDALLGDFISVDVIGGGSNTVTLAGVTAQSGYQLTAVSGGNVEARCDVAASFIASTRTISAGGAGATATLALVDGDFTSNNLNLTATHTNRVLDLTAVTIPVSLSWQTDAAGGYETTSTKLRVLAGPTCPVAIVAGTGATLIGGVQVIEQSCWGGGHRTAANTLAIIAQRKSVLALGGDKFGFCAPRLNGAINVDTFGMAVPGASDGGAAATSAANTDGIAVYGALDRVRYNNASAVINKCAGLQQTLSAKTTANKGIFPIVFRAAIADALSACPTVFGLVSNGTVNLGSSEPNAMAYDFIVMGCESTDTNMQLMCKQNTGSMTKIDLGANFPVAQYVAYELTLYKNTAGTAFIAAVRNMNTGAAVAKVLTTNIPRTSSFYSTWYNRSSFASAATASIDFIGTYIGVTC